MASRPPWLHLFHRAWLCVWKSVFDCLSFSPVWNSWETSLCSDYCSNEYFLMNKQKSSNDGAAKHQSLPHFPALLVDFRSFQRRCLQLWSLSKQPLEGKPSVSSLCDFSWATRYLSTLSQGHPKTTEWNECTICSRSLLTNGFLFLPCCQDDEVVTACCRRLSPAKCLPACLLKILRHQEHHLLTLPQLSTMTPRPSPRWKKVLREMSRV